MKTLAILAIAVLAASHLSAQTETVLKAKATDALTESIVIPSGKSVTIASGATITAASGSTVTGFGGNPAWGDITGTPTTLTGFGITDAQPLDSDLTSYAASPSSALAAVIDAAPSTDAFAAYKFAAIGTSGPVDGVLYTLAPSAFLTYLDNYYPRLTGTLPLAGFASITGTLATANIADSAITNAKLAGSIALSKLAMTGTANSSTFARGDGTWAAASTDLASPGPIGGTTPSTIAGTVITAANGTVTSSTPALNVVQTWNGSGAFIAADVNITATATGSSAVYDHYFLRANVGESAVGGLMFYYNSLAFRGQEVQLGNRGNGISRQNDSTWNMLAGDAYMASIRGTELRLASNVDLTWKGDTAPYSGSPDTRIQRTAAAALKVGDATTGYGIIEDLYRRVGSGSPEGSITAPVGAIYHRTDTGDIWRKTSGSGNTGWVTP